MGGGGQSVPTFKLQKRLCLGLQEEKSIYLWILLGILSILINLPSLSLWVMVGAPASVSDARAARLARLGQAAEPTPTPPIPSAPIPTTTTTAVNPPVPPTTTAPMDTVSSRSSREGKKRGHFVFGFHGCLLTFVSLCM